MGGNALVSKWVQRTSKDIYVTIQSSKILKTLFARSRRRVEEQTIAYFFLYLL